MNRITVTYQFTGFDVLYNKKPSWNNCDFEMCENGDAILKIWKDFDKGDIDNIYYELANRVESFGLALKYQCYRNLEWKKLKCEKNILQNDGVIKETIILSDEVIAETSLRTPPIEMPSVPISCKRWILTYSEAFMLNKTEFVDEQLKRHYLIIEELWEELRNEESPSEKGGKIKDIEIKDVDNIRNIRNFVSHPYCYGSEVKTLVSEELPSAITKKNNKPCVCFERDNIEHITYVARYEVKAREIAKKLIDEKIRYFSPNSTNQASNF